MKTSAIVLHALKYGESQLIVDLFTRDAGRVSFFCHLPKSNKGKIKNAGVKNHRPAGNHR